MEEREVPEFIEQGKHKRAFRIIVRIAMAVGVLLLLLFALRYAQYVNYKKGGSIPQIGGFTLSEALSSGDTEEVGRTELETDDDPSLGPRDAKVVIVEFGDFQCPFCKA